MQIKYVINCAPHLCCSCERNATLLAKLALSSVRLRQRVSKVLLPGESTKTVMTGNQKQKKAWSDGREEESHLEGK